MDSAPHQLRHTLAVQARPTTTRHDRRMAQPHRGPQRTAVIGFLLLFPGFFVYQALVAARLVPPVLGGGAGVFAVVSLVALVLSWAQRPRVPRSALTPFTVLVLAWAIYVVLWSATHVILNPSSNTLAVGRQVAETLVYLTTLYLVGRLLPLTEERFHRLVVVSAVLMIAYVIGVAVVHGESFIYNTPAFQRGEGVASYQGLARSVFVMAIASLAFSRSFAMRATLSVGAVVALYLVGARSEFIGIIVAVAAYWALLLSRGVKAWVALVTVAALCVAAATTVDWEAVSNSRQFQVFDVAAASSWIARTQLQSNALEVIRRSPVLGDFASHVGPSGSTGSYAHNALSAWSTFGVVGFALYFAMSVAAVLMAGSVMLRSRLDPTAVFVFILALTVLLLLGTTKSVFWIAPGLAWGLATNQALSWNWSRAR